MKKIKLSSFFVFFATISATAIFPLPLVSCSEKAIEVNNATDFLAAIENKEVKKIKLTDDIVFDNVADVAAIKLFDSKTIFCDKKNMHTISAKWEHTNETDASLMQISNTDPTKKLNIVLENVKLTASHNTWSTLICVNNALNTTLTIKHCDLSYAETQETGNVRGNALTIEETNIAKSGCKIDISNGSTLSGWSAIYNKGSYIALNATDSTFIGINDYPVQIEYGSPIYSFATIIMADYPITTDRTGEVLHRRFSANNQFNFKNCKLKAKANEGITKQEHQFIFECRSPANNTLNLDNKTLANIETYLPNTSKKNVFACANECAYSININNVNGYSGIDKPSDFPSLTKIEDYYNYYKEGTKRSQMYVDNKTYDKLTDDALKALFMRCNLNEEWHYVDADANK